MGEVATDGGVWPLEQFRGRFGEPTGRVLLVTAPGRTEIAGNHTDHEGGTVVAGAVRRYVQGVFAPRADGLLRVASEGFDPIEVDLSELDARVDERDSSAALVRGLAAGMARAGVRPACGFDAYLTSGVAVGSGLSSSAAFELALAQAMNGLWAEGSLDAARLAGLAQAAERDYFGKPCGLMDQMAVALGGIARMDFSCAGCPDVTRLDYDFADDGFALCLVSVGADHSANTADYAAVPQEMQAVARAFGREVLSEVSESDLLHRLGEVRASLGDRATLRAMHYFREERLVEARFRALEAHDMAAFLEATTLSGASSAMYLQNVSIGGSAEQPAMVALAVAEELLGGRGAARIHGGGFGGTIQAFVRTDEAEEFCRAMDEALGGEVAEVLAIDPEGARFAWA
jgi:galactokinase